MRDELVQRCRAAIDAGTYETLRKIDIATGRLLEAIRDGYQRRERCESWSCFAERNAPEIPPSVVEFSEFEEDSHDANGRA